MGAPSVASVVVVPFPFSDLSVSKRRPAVVLADAGKGDWILCMVTSNAYADAGAIEVRTADLLTGSLHRTSYARPSKLFTASELLISDEIGRLRGDVFDRIRGAVVKLFQ